ncbi:MAG: phosphomethylpyrimidine synthase, partial [Eubacteriales bacterium]|nr:phosphomethylpyrimidine synthase [Eubacteriales bacterium]
HAADIVKGVRGAREWDERMARARKALNWEEQISLAIDPEKARRLRCERNRDDVETCTMCGEYCAMKVAGEYLNQKK